MATLGLEDDELKSVEQMVSRLAQLSSSIQSLKNDILRSNPLPPPSSIQASAQILQRNLQNVLLNLQENSDLFNRMAIRPSTNFPGRTQEGTLGQLLRKKLEPDVEELVAKGRETARLVTPEGLAELQEVWDSCRAWTGERIARYIRDEAWDPYTREEREIGIENVRTGLRRALEEEEGDEDEDEDEDDDGDSEEGEGDGGKIRGLEAETLMWFAARGDFAVPPNIQYENKDPYKGLQGVNIPPDDSEQS